MHFCSLESDFAILFFYYGAGFVAHNTEVQVCNCTVSEKFHSFGIDFEEPHKVWCAFHLSLLISC